MAHLLRLFVLVLLPTQLFAQDDHFVIELDKDVTTKLPGETKVSLWQPSNKIGWQKFSLNEFPIKVPRSQLAAHSWNLTFVSKKETLFGIHFAKSFLQDNKTYKIAFKDPVVVIRYLPIAKEIRCTFQIGNGTEYTELPRLDLETKMLQASLPPVIEVTANGSGEKLYYGSMVDGCLGIKWSCFLRDLDQSLVKDSRATVTFDTGRLFTYSVSSQELAVVAK